MFIFVLSIRPFDHGYMTKAGIQLQIWNRMFSACIPISPHDHNLIMTDPPFNFDNIQNDMNEVVFEEYEFPNYMRRTSSYFSAYEFSQSSNQLFPDILSNTKLLDCCTIIDSGFSFTHVLPYIAMKPQNHAVNIS